MWRCVVYDPVLEVWWRQLLGRQPEENLWLVISICDKECECLLGLLSNSVREPLGLIEDLFLTESDRGPKAIMRMPLLEARAEWNHVYWEILKEGWLAGGHQAVWFPRGSPTQNDMCTSLQSRKTEIKALKYPFPSRPKVWKYFLSKKLVLLVLQELDWHTAVMRNPGARHRPIMGDVLPPD